MKCAPVTIPTLCRSTHFIRLIESLKQNTWAKYTDVYIGLDYPPSEKYMKGWKEINHYLDNEDFSAFAAFKVFRHNSNIGSTCNNKYLRDYVLKKHDRYIRFDDDNEVSPNFLEYINKCLDKYEDDEDVIAVCGYSYPINWKVSEGATVLKQNINAAVWGVGFWKKKYIVCSDYLNSSKIIQDFPKVVKTKSYKKMIDVAQMEYFTSTCFSLKIGGIKKYMQCASDIGLRAYLAVSGKHAISPVISKVRNYGFDGTGTGCQMIDSTSEGNTAGTYNYKLQPIDTANSFDIREDTLMADAENRELLNKFDYRSKKQLNKTRRSIFLCEHVGIWAAKLYRNVEFPFDLIKRSIYKLNAIIQ